MLALWGRAPRPENIPLPVSVASSLTETASLASQADLSHLGPPPLPPSPRYQTDVDLAEQGRGRRQEGSSSSWELSGGGKSLGFQAKDTDPEDLNRALTLLRFAWKQHNKAKKSGTKSGRQNKKALEIVYEDSAAVGEKAKVKSDMKKDLLRMLLKADTEENLAIDEDESDFDTSVIITTKSTKDYTRTKMSEELLRQMLRHISSLSIVIHDKFVDLTQEQLDAFSSLIMNDEISHGPEDDMKNPRFLRKIKKMLAGRTKRSEMETSSPSPPSYWSLVAKEIIRETLEEMDASEIQIRSKKKRCWVKRFCIRVGQFCRVPALLWAVMRKLGDEASPFLEALHEELDRVASETDPHNTRRLGENPGRLIELQMRALERSLDSVDSVFYSDEGLYRAPE
ncbi:hypothetical protein FQN54_009607 [Arachnomyces sp. PD_36]|nr:hypothetical protein FQN54_009607 [Arachnomyces sp. PD_36]